LALAFFARERTELVRLGLISGERPILRGDLEMAELEKEYDVIVIGGGVNGLTCAAYLQKAGLKVALFERREEVGTHCVTEEVMEPGVRVNIHATFIVAHMGAAMEDLELDKFGYEPVTSSEWAYLHPFKDGTAGLLHIADARKTYEAWKRLNERDAEQYRRIMNYLGPLWPEIMRLAIWEPASPATLLQAAEIISKCPGIPPDWLDMTGLELADLLFEDDRIKATILTPSTEGGISPWYREGGNMAPIFGLGSFFFRWHCRGGSHALPHALARCFLHHGGKLFQGCPVEKIIVDRGEAKGVVLSKHAVYPEAEVKATKAVVSDLTAYPTFIQLVGPDKLPPEATAGAMAYNYNGQILFVNYWILKEPPQWVAAEKFPEGSRAFGFNFGVEGPQDLVRLHNDMITGHLPDPPIGSGGCCQGYVFADPTQAPPGYYTLMTWCDVPFDLRRYGGPHKWDDIREEYGDKVEDLLAEYMPNLKRAKVARYIHTPLDTYRRNPSAIKGTWSGGDTCPTQFWHNRPFAGCGAPRTPIAKLYISNSIWPHCGTWLGSGHAAAKVVAEDVGVGKQEWWVHKPLGAYPQMVRKYGLEYHPTVD